MEEKQKYCKHCGEVIDRECVVFPKCGKQVENIGNINPNIIVNNSSSASASASAAATVTSPTKRKKKYNLLLDLLLIFCTGGLWIIWMIVRPKYEY